MENIKVSLVKAVIRMLHPLVRILLTHEVAHSEFAEMAKRAYVDVAYKYFSIPKRKQTFSRVSVLTGLSRKEVVRLTNISKDEPPLTKGPLNRAVRVISGWLRDPDFLDKNSEPKTLSLRGDASSFEELVDRYSGDITSRAILDELIRVGAVEKLEGNKVKLRHHGYIPDESLTEKIDVLSTHVHDLLTTGVYNLSQEKEHRRFQRQVTYHDMPQSVIDEFQKYSHDKCLALLLDFNRWLAQKKKTVQVEQDEPTGRVGVGIYYFNNDKEGE
jgi:hypothetical protein